MALLLYAVTLFISAFILFLVQPIVGKIILPKLGGTPQVWNTCMVFFQMALLAGYAYTHNATTRLSLRQQLVAHLVLLVLPLMILLPFPFAFGGEFAQRETGSITNASNTSPIEITTASAHNLATDMRTHVSGVQGNTAANGTWTIAVIDANKFTLNMSKGTDAYESGGTFIGGLPNPHSLWGFVPDLGSNPIPSTLLVLLIYIALPFLVVATTAPLLQKWFVHTGHPASKDPYFLYGASNLGSMLSLIIYPILIEPELKLAEQGWLYTIGYLCLAVFVLACAALVWHSKEVKAAAHLFPVVDNLSPMPRPTDIGTAPPIGTAEPQTGVTATPPAPTPAPAAASTALKKGAPPAKGKPVPKGHSPADASVSIAADNVDFARRFRWVMLAAIPSSLMLGITTHITTDLSPMPLFWLVPLILYLGSFILVFMRWPIVWTVQAHIYFLIAQPICIAGMILADVMNWAGDTRWLPYAILAHVLGFFTTTMVCHGELAKDRPSTKHLTEFYLWMSVGGMVGGMFNALIAPVIFTKLFELPLAIFAAVMVRPRMFETGLLDNFLASLFEGKAEAPAHKPGQKGHKPVVHASAGTAVANESLVSTLDYAWPVGILVLMGVLLLVLKTTPSEYTKKEAADINRNMFIVFGMPLLVACICMARPLRVGLGVGFVLLVFQLHHYMNDASIYSNRSYFGIISVKDGAQQRKIGDKVEKFVYRQLIHGHIDHGMNFLMPTVKADRQNPEKDLSRLATTYYHREGPVGRVMERFNWFPGPPNSNTYKADARICASLTASAIADIGTTGALPMTALVTAWSEPPIATVGLGTGTMASYGRPYQHVHFYEIDNQIRLLSLGMPTREIRDYKQYLKDYDTNLDPYRFNYLSQAIERGSSVQVLMGDARLRMSLPYRNHYETFLKNEPDDGGGPENFYHMMVVDAFSSDAIPAHLLTMESFEMYFKHLAPDGVLCVHTSNRFVDLPKVVAAVASKMGYAYLRGHDNDTDRAEGHYTSEWVMVARNMDALQFTGKGRGAMAEKSLSGDAKFLDRYEKNIREEERKTGKAIYEVYWQSVNVNYRYVWTDDHYNLLSVVRFRPRQDD